jgi:dipeptidyl aminopeptidase/acylaminoacyl peptidase
MTAPIAWDIESIAVARDGSRVAILANEDGYSRLWLLEPKSGALEKVDLPAGVVRAMRFPEKNTGMLFFSLEGARSPADAWSLDLASRKLTRWTRSEVGGIATAAIPEPVLVRYPAKDGLKVPAFVTRPVATPRGGKLPVVVVWHGGPEGQNRPGFSPFVALLAELGIAVVEPNPRGSTGYGKAFLSMDDGVKREESLADVAATFDWIASQPDLDASRVGVYGGSYGGYLVLASVAFFPSRVRAGVDVVGISSLPSFLASTQAYRRDLRRAEYGDERIPAVRAVQERISPLGSADKIEAALFVVQGKNDPRVPQSEAEQIVKAVRAHGKDAWYLLALDEGHGFQKKPNRDLETVAIVRFFEEKLLQPTPPGH